jgi:hypothetical protein
MTIKRRSVGFAPAGGLFWNSERHERFIQDSNAEKFLQNAFVSPR